MTDTIETTLLSIEDILGMIPHRYPFLLVDRVLSFNKGKNLTALKNVTMNEPFFQGHFPGKPVMPGVLIIEALAQASALYTVLDTGEGTKDKLVYFMSIEQAKFRKPVTPGDSLKLCVEPIQQRRNVHKMRCVATADGEKMTEATVTAMIADSQ